MNDFPSPLLLGSKLANGLVLLLSFWSFTEVLHLFSRLMFPDLVLERLSEHIFLYFLGYFQIPETQNLNRNIIVPKWTFIP